SPVKTLVTWITSALSVIVTMFTNPKKVRDKAGIFRDLDKELTQLELEHVAFTLFQHSVKDKAVLQSLLKEVGPSADLLEDISEDIMRAGDKIQKMSSWTDLF